MAKKQEKQKSENLEVSLLNSVTSDNIGHLIANAGEIALDSFFENEIIQQIPIFGSIYKLAKVGLGVREQFFAKKVYNFLIEIKDIPRQERENFIRELEENDKTCQRAGETLLILLEKCDHLEKPHIMGRLLRAKMNQKINIDTFLRLSFIVDRAFIYDLYKLPDFKENKNPHGVEISESLQNIGLIRNTVIDNGGIVFEPDDFSGRDYQLSKLGFDLINYGLNNFEK